MWFNNSMIFVLIATALIEFYIWLSRITIVIIHNWGTLLSQDHLLRVLCEPKLMRWSFIQNFVLWLVSRNYCHVVEILRALLICVPLPSCWYFSSTRLFCWAIGMESFMCLRLLWLLRPLCYLFILIWLYSVNHRPEQLLALLSPQLLLLHQPCHRCCVSTAIGQGHILLVILVLMSQIDDLEP